MRIRDADYAKPSMPRVWAGAGRGWGWGVGCGAGVFFGMGVGVSPFGRSLFGAGVATGAFCGVGLGGGMIGGLGTLFLPHGIPILFTPKPPDVSLPQKDTWPKILERIRSGWQTTYRDKRNIKENDCNNIEEMKEFKLKEIQHSVGQQAQDTTVMKTKQ